jgi:CHAT domain-containing protein
MKEPLSPIVPSRLGRSRFLAHPYRIPRYGPLAIVCLAVLLGAASFRIKIVATVRDLIESITTFGSDPIIKPIVAAIEPGSQCRLTAESVLDGRYLARCEKKAPGSRSQQRAREILYRLMHCQDPASRLLTLARTDHRNKLARDLRLPIWSWQAWHAPFTDNCRSGDLTQRLVCALKRMNLSASDVVLVINHMLNYQRSERPLAPQLRSAIRPSLRGAWVHFNRRLDNTKAAADDLDRALSEVERWHTLVDPSISFLDSAQPLFNQAATLQLSGEHSNDALCTIDRAHGRFLLDRLQEAATSIVPGALNAPIAVPWPCQDLCRRLPPATVALAYAEIDDHLVTWLIGPSGIEISPVRPSFSAVARLVRGVNRQMRTDMSAQALIELGALYQMLVGPWQEQLPAGVRIVFIPAAELWGVPFAALRDPHSGHFLIQDHSVGVAPSLSALVSLAEIDHQAAAQPLTSALIVASPTTGEEARVLPPLAAAAREKNLVAGIYGRLNTRVLAMADATPRHVLDSLPQADVAHFALHGLYDRRSHTEPSLQLARGGEDQGTLSSDRILALRLPHTRLVFLAACNTQPGPPSPSEGPLGLAHAFLATGVPAVVASLWNVEDEATARLSVAFHDEIALGADPLTALREAQIAEIASGPRDWTWAAFEVLGGTFPRSSTAEVH